ncbi:MAG: 50S ribosomal protein L15 [Fibrobacteraceae bacterium]|nr:50S ribosomal protein L15 [Fibrobacteraceae bacterium]
MELNNINPGKAALTKGRKRIGRGPGSGWGTTAGRGQKGAGARKSAKAGRVAFEGGQMPIHRRIPKRGFKSHFVHDTQIVNLKALAASSVVDFDAKVLADQGLVRSVKKPIKVLGYGTITKAISLKVNAISEKAKAAVLAAGGKVEIVK